MEDILPVHGHAEIQKFSLSKQVNYLSTSEEILYLQVVFIISEQHQ